MKKKTTLRLIAVLENVPVAVEYVAQAAQAIGFARHALCQIEGAVDEACANIVEHAYEGMTPGYMEVSCHLEDHSFVIKLRDWGKSFSPNDVAEPKLDAPLDERSLGGLGLFLIRQFMDDVRFRSDPASGNELHLVKRLAAAD